MRIYLNDEWNYADQYEETMCSGDYNVSMLHAVRLPHTVTQTPFDYFSEEVYQKVSGYRRILRWNPAWQGKKLVLTFEGAAHQASVYLNGKLVYEHFCGYTAFSVDITELIQRDPEADNILVVKLDSRESLNQPPFGFVIDYMTYGGLYREVYLDVYEPVYVKDVFVKTPAASEKEQKLVCEVTLSEKVSHGSLIQRLIDQASGKVIDQWVTQADGEMICISRSYQTLCLWDNEVPYLYRLETVYTEHASNTANTKNAENAADTEHAEAGADKHTVRFGFRTCQFQKDGFYLNGKKVKLRGVNRHQSYPYAGYAMPEKMQKLDADIIKKELGCNAVRTSHYPQSQHFIDRCDELGLLVFTEIPGWQHIGDASWKEQAIQNTKDMVLQYRNHPSIILWGVRINESQDDDDFYRRTNKAAHELDDTRQTGGVRAHKKSSLLEDVYTYNDFVHDGTNQGCESKKKVTSDMDKGYLISEYNGHMYPAKAFDWEEHRVEHAMRHARVLDAVQGEEDIAGSFAWCMFDYNTHKDFGSGDRICYHGLMDQFRNPKLAAAIYAAEAEPAADAAGIVLRLSSSMDIGEHPGCNRGNTYIITNAESVRMYKNDIFIREYTGRNSEFSNLKHGPILIDDFIGNQIEENEHFTRKQAAAVKKTLNTTARTGLGGLPLSIKWIAVKMVLFYHMKPTEAVTLYNRYVGDWGGSSTVYRFEALQDGRVVKTIVKKPMTKRVLSVSVDHTELVENRTYDAASIRIRAIDENGNELNFLNEPVSLQISGPIELIGPSVTALRGGMGGTYVKTTGESGEARLTIHLDAAENVELRFSCKVKTDQSLNDRYR